MRRNDQLPDGATPAEASFAEAVEPYQCPHCNHPFGAATNLADALLTRVNCPQCAALFLVPGRIGDFVLTDRITTDGTGNVYRANGGAYPHEVALKVLPAFTDASSTVRDQILATIRTAAQVNHLHLAKIYAPGLAHELPYLVMELPGNTNLESRLQDARRMSEREVLRMALDVAAGLAALHNAGLIHGNVNPENIVLDADGSAKLTNPGLLSALRRDARGGFLGAPLYVAPELIKGGDSTPQSDIYSLGVTLYYLLAGQPPFAGTTTDEIYKNHLFAVVFPVGVHAPALSSLTREIVGRMLRRDPAERFSDCHALANEIRRALTTVESSPAATPVVNHPAVHLKRRHSYVFRPLLGFGATVAVVAGVVFFALFWESAPIEPPKVAPPRPPVVLPKRVIRKTIPPTTVPPRQFFDAACTAAVATCTRRMKTDWQHITIGEDISHGLTLWRGEMVTVIGGGEGIGGLKDNGRFIYTTAGTPYVASLCVLHIPSTHPRAQIGLLARKNNAATAPCVFVGFTGNGNLLLLCRSKDGAELEVVRTVLATMEEWSPCYLKLENNRGQFRAFVSRDNATWECIGTCQAAIPDYGKVGIAIASLTPDTMATADCKDIRLLIPPPSAPTGAGSPNPTP